MGNPMYPESSGREFAGLPTTAGGFHPMSWLQKPASTRRLYVSQPLSRGTIVAFFSEGKLAEYELPFSCLMAARSPSPMRPRGIPRECLWPPVRRNLQPAAALGRSRGTDLLGTATAAALYAAWYQRWFVHRRLRPGVWGGAFTKPKRVRRISHPLRSNEFRGVADGLDG